MGHDDRIERHMFTSKMKKEKDKNKLQCWFVAEDAHVTIRVKHVTSRLAPTGWSRQAGYRLLWAAGTW